MTEGSIHAVEASDRVFTPGQCLQAAEIVTRQRVGILPPQRRKVIDKIFNKQNALAVAGALMLLFNVAGCANTPKVDVGQQIPPVTQPAVTESAQRSTKDSVSTPTPDKQKYKDVLPKDLIKEQELADIYYTHIYNAPDIKMHLRQTALTEEPIFAWLKEQKGKATFDLVLVDGPFMHTDFFTPEQKQKLPELVEELQRHEKAASRVNQEGLAKMKDAAVKQINQQRQDLESRLSQGKISQDQYNLELRILEKGFQLYTNPSEEDLRVRQMGGFVNIMNPKWRPDSNVPITKLYAVIAVGKDQQGTGNYRPQPSQSFLDPNNLRIDESRQLDQASNEVSGEPSSIWKPDYFVKGWGGASIWRHEVGHFSGGLSEARTDAIALAGLRKAWEAYQRGDDSLYYYVLETPEGNVLG